jgi:hypothetical protein
MRKLIILACALACGLALSTSAPAAGDTGKLNLYTARVDAAQASALARAGYDIAAVHQGFAGLEVDLVLSPRKPRSWLRASA